MSPTILTVDGFGVRIRRVAAGGTSTRSEHGPAHVHVVKAGAELVILLGDEQTPPSIRRSPYHAMRRADVAAALRIVNENRDTLLAEWRHLNG